MPNPHGDFDLEGNDLTTRHNKSVIMLHTIVKGLAGNG